jgi:hypothetical protein
VFNGVDWRYRSQGKILASVTAKFGDPKTTSKTLYKGTKYEINWPVKVVKSVKITAPKNYALSFPLFPHHRVPGQSIIRRLL